MKITVFSLKIELFCEQVVMISIESYIEFYFFVHSNGLNPEGCLNNTNLKFKKYNVRLILILYE